MNDFMQQYLGSGFDVCWYVVAMSNTTGLTVVFGFLLLCVARCLYVCRKARYGYGYVILDEDASFACGQFLKTWNMMAVALT